MRIESLGIPVTAPQAPALPEPPPVAAGPGRSPAAPDPGTVQQAVKAANVAVRAFSNSVEFSFDEQIGRNVVRVVDAETRTLIRQIPSEEMLAIARALDRLQGLLVQEQA